MQQSLLIGSEGREANASTKRPGTDRDQRIDKGCGGFGALEFPIGQSN